MPELEARAVRLLARRDHSRAELSAKLAPLAESTEQLEALLDDLEARQLLSDRRFASLRVASRAPRLGNTRLRLELKSRGVDDATIAAALPEAGEELGRCCAVRERKFGDLPGSAEDRARQYRFLHTRGFSPDAIRRALAGGED